MRIDLDAYYEYEDGTRVQLDRAWAIRTAETLSLLADFREGDRPYSLHLEGRLVRGATFVGEIMPAKAIPQDQAWDHAVPLMMTLAAIDVDEWRFTGIAQGEPDGSNDYRLDVHAVRQSR